MDQKVTYIKPIMESTYGKDSATKWTAYWRAFFIVGKEFLAYNNDISKWQDEDEYVVSHPSSHPHSRLHQ
ncbi:hypothetical protein JHK82_055891 [Glycine max]|nr:hypothetical protein JHK86_055714 [Glycine max]KAG4918439.1 hypothetical protein JHK85_056720 [Glycine max]KAG5077196.1 hypothetical protein JHK82_055891 [Glycine max]